MSKKESHFQIWWKTNKALYEPLNVSEDVARTIWNAAIDAVIIEIASK